MNGLFRPQDRAGMGCPGTGTLQANRLEEGSPVGTEVPLSSGSWPKQLFGKDIGMALAGGPRFHSVWPTLEDDKAPGCWEQPIRQGEEAQVWVAGLPLHPSYHLLAGNWQGVLGAVAWWGVCRRGC